jgi:hypothetical protein
MHNSYEYGIRVKFRSELGVEVTTAEPFFCEPLTDALQGWVWAGI